MQNFQKEVGYFVFDNSQKETHTYTLGKDNYIPISLLLSLLSSYEKSPQRVLNLFTSTYSIQKENINFKKIISKKEQNEIKEKFDSKYIGTSISKMKEKIDLTPDYKEMELWNYVEIWTKILNSATPLFETNNEGIPLACSIDYIRFYNRPEFNLPYEFTIKALISIINEVSLIMKKCGFELSHDGYLLKLNGFKPLQIEEYYGF